MPELVLAELLKHKELLCNKTGLSPERSIFHFILSSFQSRDCKKGGIFRESGKSKKHNGKD